MQPEGSVHTGSSGSIFVAGKTGYNNVRISVVRGRGVALQWDS